MIGGVGISGSGLDDSYECKIKKFEVWSYIGWSRVFLCILYKGCIESFNTMYDLKVLIVEYWSRRGDATIYVVCP